MDDDLENFSEIAKPEVAGSVQLVGADGKWAELPGTLQGAFVNSVRIGARHVEFNAASFARSKFNSDGSVRNHKRIRDTLEQRERSQLLNKRGAEVLAAYRKGDVSWPKALLLSILLILILGLIVFALFNRTNQFGCGRADQWQCDRLG